MKVLRWWVGVLVCALMCAEIGDATLPGTGGLLSKMTCILCKAKVGRYLVMLRSGMPLKLIVGEAKLLCVVFGGYSSAVCSGIINRWKNQVSYIVRHSSVSAAEVCGSLTESCQFTVARTWAVSLPPPPPPHYRRRRRRRHAPGGHSKQLKVLQIADVHIQLDYAAGSRSDCSNGLFCCRPKDGYPRRANRLAAGAWGTYENCDTPPKLFSTMLRHIRHQHPDISYIMWTGDNAPHNLHETSRAGALTANAACTDLIHAEFPDTLVLPVLGNHDTHPVNSFPPPSVNGPFSNDWLFGGLQHIWRPLFQGRMRYVSGGDDLYNSFTNTFDRMGYYYIRVKKARLRIVVINTNFCYNLNFWTLLEPRDPGGQLRWLVGQLAEAEAAGDHVHIVGHISPGDPGCRPDWSHQYTRIVRRFADTIAAQFFSHTHLDEYQVVLDAAGNAISTVYIAPSVSPWVNLNPGYKLYHIDPYHWEVTDTERWATDLEEANKHPSRAPLWHQLYSARPAYSLPSLAPHQWLALAHRMAVQPAFFQQVWSNYWGGSRRRDTCRASCQRTTLCNIVTFDRSDSRACDRILELRKGARHG